MGKISLTDQIAALSRSGRTDDGFPEDDDEDYATKAKVVDVGDDDQLHDPNEKVTRSALRARNVKPLNELDERYAGAKTSRKRLAKSFELPTSKKQGALKFLKSKTKVKESSSEDEDDEEEESNGEEEITQAANGISIEDENSESGMEDESDVVGGDSASDIEDSDADEDSDEEEDSGAEDLSKSEVADEDENESETDINTLSTLDKAGEIEKGMATQQQLRIWDTLLEVRIRMQKMLLESNKLPQKSTLSQVIEASSSSDDIKLTSSLEKSRSTIKDFLEKLVELQETIIKQNPDTVKCLSAKKRKAPEQDDENEDMIPSDEEITSSEDEEQDKKVKKEDEVPKILENTKNPKRKKRKIEEYDKIVQKNFEEFTPYRNQTIQKWNDKTQLSFGKFGKKSASSHEIGTLKQIEHILSDKPRLIKRTQVKRSAYQTIGKHVQSDEPVEGQDQRDTEIFDDDDFYHQLLRELIERKTSNTKDPIQLSRHWLELQKLRSKLKRKVDTKASKGRKIRYDVHTKLVNFMAPMDHCSMSENAVKELMNSLFGESK